MTQIIETGGGGNCMFSSVAYFLNKPHETVRKEIVEYMIEKRKEITSGGIKLCCLVKLSEGVKIKQYAERMSQIGVDGGEIELFVASILYHRTIKVYDQNLKLVYQYGDGEQEIKLRYSSGHYQALV